MEELVDSTYLAEDQKSLQTTFARDGYLLIRSALDPDDLNAAASAVRAALQRGGWIDADGTMLPEGCSPDARASHPAYRAAADSVEFHRLPYLAPLRRLVANLLGPNVYPLPSKVLRATPPAQYKTEPGRFAHQDFSYWGINDMITTWVPLMDISEQLGGLALLPGSHLEPQVELRVLSSNEARWATTQYRMGDVVLFHCLTTHAALPNMLDALRISGDFRWQLPEEPVSAELIFGAKQRVYELFSQALEHEPGWTPVPSSVPIVEGRTYPLGRSRLFPVHPSWQEWSEPDGGFS